MKILLALICLSGLYAAHAQSFTDEPFRQTVSEKYELAPELKNSRLIKVVVDYDDIVHLLTDQGLYRDLDDQIIKDISYRPLADLNPKDITIQEGTGYLYYLYDNKFLTNAFGGKHYGYLPEGKFQKLAVNARQDVLLTGNREAALHRNGEIIPLKLPAGKSIQLAVDDREFYYLTPESLFKLQKNKFKEIHAGVNLSSVCFRENEILISSDQGYYGIDKLTYEPVFPLQTKLPATDIHKMILTEDGIWAATSKGAFWRKKDGKFRYFASQRWLDQDRVIDIAADSEGNIILLTPTGLNKVRFQTQTLEEKAAYFDKKVRQRHIRYGFIAELLLNEPGDVTSAEMIDTDNDGLWTAFYFGSQAWRYAATGEEKARRNCLEAFEAYERLLSLNQLKGFPSRTFERKGYKFSDVDRWRDSPDPEWEWKGHTSSDEFVAYIFVASLMNEFIAETEKEKKRAATFIDAIMTHLIENDYYFVDIDGKPTLWGRWNPEYINWYPRTIRDRRLGSLTLTAGFQLAYDLTGKEIYREEAYKMFEEHGYLENLQIDLYKIKETPGYDHLGHNMGEGGWNHSDDEMAFLTYWVIHRHAFNQELQQIYEKSIRNHWEIEKPERNALWNLITLETEGSFDQESTIWHLRDYPMDVLRYTNQNSHRQDLERMEENFRKQETKELISAQERRIIRYNTNPFQLDGGHEMRYELSGAEYLAPYWLGRYLGVIEPSK